MTKLPHCDNSATTGRDTLAVYRPHDLANDEDGQLARCALRLRALQAAIRPHNRTQVLAAMRREFEAVGVPIRRWPLIVQDILSGAAAVVVEDNARPWPVWRFLELATGVAPAADPADPVGMLSCMPLPWEELLNFVCQVLREPPSPAPGPEQKPADEPDHAAAEHRWRVRAGLASGPPPRPKTGEPPGGTGGSSHHKNSGCVAAPENNRPGRKIQQEFSAALSCADFTCAVSRLPARAQQKNRGRK